ncbi:MAG: hypothetical protein A2508_03185 [Candidatus Lambdaproteobacteria bacterium RIFOXYD12_FULL_49_8]|uniref:D-glycero-beta-D-manno-heptose 1-phosphate adenylyltransferase n=1 Tax=Candidatus Lambdaproteobacteria bacterium RIFOXYD2_FULL_50_16 TaxID=1817772 RepID=A0A1F6GEU7_9PROT|nr:MAG: hypothetical protein A2527_03500 [Candidatus Lambdaproteobacteria bacterium RIFOXYD2_FULL_50_16]OGG97848.1 MAG: hypothetical protein A2508_03185 [Candidatus Lambdaproteobacteria bacterium RIFOXYD12_FULL_49_8]
MDQLTEKKINSRDQLQPLLGLAQASGEKVVFTNGCFDLVHKGHTRYLRAARAQGDRLVVAVNDDASVSRLKGPSRPIVPLAERMEILAGFYFIDWVTWFAEDTPLETIKLLKPDRLIKGADYALDQIVGRAEVESWGGAVKTIELVPDSSTSGVVERILSAYRDQHV